MECLKVMQTNTKLVFYYFCLHLTYFSSSISYCGRKKYTGNMLVFTIDQYTCRRAICLMCKGPQQHNQFMVLHVVPRTAQNQTLALIFLPLFTMF